MSRRRHGGRGWRLAGVGAVAAAAAVAACVEITAGEGGVASIRLDPLPLPPSIVIGDTLRDSTGAPLRLRAIAFGSEGDTIHDAPFRFVYVPLSRDTARPDNEAIEVDSLTGVVVAAPPPFVAPQGRVGVRLGTRLQLLDTLEIVPQPRDLVYGPQDGDSTRRLWFFCRDLPNAPLSSGTLTAAQADSAGAGAATGDRFGNVTTLTTRLFGDSATNDSARVRQFLVQYAIVAPTDIPTVQLDRGRTRAAIEVIDGSSDTPLRFDTTDASGLASPRLRIFPSAVPAAGATDSVVVRVRARARWHTPAGAPAATRGRVVDSVDFVVRLRPFANSPITGQPITCP